VEEFRNPPARYRGVPFWSINDRLDPEEAARQVRLLGEGGYGGVFFHAREGLVTPFLSEEWFQAFKASLEEAEKLGMQVWIYDELWWPSGFAGGTVPSRGHKYRAKALLAIPGEISFAGPEVIAVFRCETDGNGLPIDYERAVPGEREPGHLYLTFVEYTAPLGSQWYYGLNYVDLLDEETVACFIREAYEPYAQRFGEAFGKAIPGVFTDEPNIESGRPPARQAMPPRGPRFPVAALPWTPRLRERFRELNGYDIVERLPELFFNVGNYTKTRFDYWRTVTTLFLESFSKQIYEWCDAHGLWFTGHYLSEDTLLSQLKCGGAVMPHYEYQHVPGIDHLGMQIWFGLLTAKQVASVANQLGRERVLCETYGCTGNYPSFADRKWIGDFLYALGVNMLNHHLVPYSLRGRRKRDYGLNFHWSQPWWRFNRLIEDHYARLSYALSRGVRVVNVLVIHPISSAWALYSPFNEAEVGELDSRFRGLLETLIRGHVDFELGDEMVMERHGRVEGPRLRIGRAVYDAVILPSCINLAHNTLRLLSEYVENGGLLIVVPPEPRMVDGEEVEDLYKILGRASRAESPAELLRLLDNVARPVRVEGDESGDVLYHLRRDGDQLILFLYNSSRAETRAVRARVEGLWRVEEWDTLTGGVRDHPAELSGATTVIDVELPPVGSKLLVMRRGAPKPGGSEAKVTGAFALEGPWRVERLELNALVLDYCRYRVRRGGSWGDWSEAMPLPRVHRRLVESGLGTEFQLRFEFQSEIDLRGRDVYLALETPSRFRLSINGVETPWADSGHWLDPSIRLMKVSDRLKVGLNEVVLEGVVGLEPELENMYVVGDFAVRAGAKCTSAIVEERGLASPEDLCREGYPFYAGSIRLVRTFNLEEEPRGRVFIRFRDLNAALAIVSVNGRELGPVFLPPYRVEATGALRKGENRVEVTLVGTLRNLLGPLHFAGGDPGWTSPETFADERNWTDEYVLRPFGFSQIVVELAE